MQQHELIDESTLLQLGLAAQVEYQDIIFTKPERDLFNDWPTPLNPEGEYKIVGLWIELS